MISIQQIVRWIMIIIVMGAIFGLLWWLVGYLALPAPFGYVAHGVLAVGAVFILIALLMEVIGKPIIKFKD